VYEPCTGHSWRTGRILYTWPYYTQGAVGAPGEVHHLTFFSVQIPTTETINPNPNLNTNPNPNLSLTLLNTTI